MHRIWVDNAVLEPGAEVAILGEEAAHAALVKRVRTGETVGLLDGRGGWAQAIVLPGPAIPKGKRAARDAELRVRVQSCERQSPPSPRVEVLTATPKGVRADELVDQLSQVGASAWGPLATARGVVDPGAHKLDRLERIAREACKQCGRAWVLDVLPAHTIQNALRADTSTRVVLCDGGGEPYRSLDHAPQAASVRLLIGPEGGWSPEELALARAAGATVARFGPYAMRIETAAVVAAGVVMSSADLASGD